MNEKPRKDPADVLKAWDEVNFSEPPDIADVAEALRTALKHLAIESSCRQRQAIREMELKTEIVELENALVKAKARHS